VTDTQLVALGLLPRPTRTPVPPPATAPVIDVVSTSGNTVKLRLHAAGDSTRRGKPAGVDGASVFSFVGATPPDTETEWTFEGVAWQRPLLDVTFPAGTAPGAKVWFTAFWFNEPQAERPGGEPGRAPTSRAAARWRLEPPLPRCEMSVRVAGEHDYSFIDRLQDMHSKALGFMPKAQLQGKIAAGHVLIAEDEMRLPIGYCMSQDRYFKRDDAGSFIR
jgi:hypothetical protein